MFLNVFEYGFKNELMHVFTFDAMLVGLLVFTRRLIVDMDEQKKFSSFHPK